MSLQRKITTPLKKFNKSKILVSPSNEFCSLSHYPNYPDNSIAKVKILVKNIHDYLFSIYMLKKVNGSASKSIQKHLFGNIETFIKLLTIECKKNKRIFKKFYEFNFIDHFSNLSLTNLEKDDYDHIYKALSILNISEKKEKDHLFTTHKILNQMHKELTYIFDSFTKNAPFYLPYAIKKAIYKRIESCKTGSTIYESLNSLFIEKRYAIIEVKQANQRASIENACTTIHILEQSLENISQRKSLPSQYKKILPKLLLANKRPTKKYRPA